MRPRSVPSLRHRAGPWVLVAGVLAGLMASSDAAATPAAFPPVNPWVTALNGGLPLTDPEGDTPGSRDIVGDAANPMLFVTADATHLYLRLRVDSDPLQNATNFGPFGWGCFINTDSNLQTYEFSTIIDGVNNPDIIYFYKNTSTTAFNDPNEAPDLPALSAISSPLTAPVGHASVSVAGSTFGGDADYFVDWVIDLSVATANGFDPAQPANYYCGSSNSANKIDADCSGGTTGGCPLDSQFTDPIQCDATGCGVCGDGVVGGPEGCDDGNFVDGDGCTSTCQIELTEPCTDSGDCASGFCDPAGNTCACDQDSDCPAGQLCDTAADPNVCVPPGCGNGILEPGEGCDDGNLADGDGCNASCLKELGEPCSGNGQCASDFCDPTSNTCACDQDADCPMGQLCNVVSDPNTCVNPGCGNLVLEPGEGCDDGNLADGDGCNASCLKELGQPCSGNNVCASDFCDPAGNICACDQDMDCPMGQLCNLASDPNVCVGSGCGNGVQEAGEACDDGNIANGDGCNSACLKELGEPCAGSGECASGFCDPDGNVCACDQNVDCPLGLLCDTVSAPNLCVAPGCGNNILEPGEGCDDGNMSSGDGCNAACLKEIGEPCAGNGVCASGFCDPAGNTCACDQDADCPMGQLCDTVSDPNVCVNPGCGNFVLEPGEGCDDGNLSNGDGCNAACLEEIGQPCSGNNVCASDFCDPAGNVCACDQDADCPLGQLCDTVSNPNVCVDPGCGNNVLEPGEGCDDGNLSNGDGCNASCLKELGEPCAGNGVCASGFCDPAGNVCACDQDADCPVGQLCDTVSDPNACVNPGCGNNVVEPGEGCDDGNTTPGDGCGATCLKEIGEPCADDGVCESGFCDPADSTCACDDDADCPAGNQCNTSLDPNECVPEGCGNGLLGPGEACDDGNLTNGDGCDAQCKKELTIPCGVDDECASGSCNATSGECECVIDSDCGGGQLCDTSGDPNQCVDSICGNGTIEGAEECDDGNTTPVDGCSETCTVEEYWGCVGEPSVCDPKPCSSDADCPYCNEQYSICVLPCAQEEDCPSSFFCDVTSGICVPFCMVGSECPSGVCNVTSGECVECATAADCPDGETCQGGVCGTGCTSNDDCASGLVCDVGAGICVECLTDAECTGGLVCIDQHCLPGCNEEVDCNGVVCNETIGVCVECTMDSDCDDGEACDEAYGQCVPVGCQSDADCPDGLVCDETTHECVECTQDSECPDGKVCDESAQVCVECTQDSECPDGKVCDEDAQVCAECTQDSECADGSVCDTSVQVCVQCLEDTQCSNGICNPTTHTCGCTADPECGEGRICNLETGACEDEPDIVVAEGNGLLCATRGDGSTESKLPLFVLGLLGLSLLRRRRRS